MLVNNKVKLKVLNPLLYNKLNNITSKGYRLIQAKNNSPTLALTIDNKELFYLSKYNPEKEAEDYVGKLGDLTSKTNVLIVGIGLGYHLEELLKQYPHLKITIFEPNLQVLKAFLEIYDLTKLKERNLNYIFSDLAEISNMNKFRQLIMKDLTVTIFPAASRLYMNLIESTLFSLKKQLEQQKTETLVDVQFQQRWTKNALLNFSTIIETPNLFLHTDIITKLYDKPVILVAAGPSLNLEFDNLKYIKEKGSAYIFAVGSAVNALIAHDIIPDALFSYDPTEDNAKVVEKIKKLNLDIPLIFGTSIAFEVLHSYPSSMLHFYTSQDSITPNLLGETKFIIADAPSIAVVTLNILLHLKPSKVILVGQNLGFNNQNSYAQGIDYINPIANFDPQKYIQIEDVHGKIMLTTNGYLSMKMGMESIIRTYNNSTEIINTTKNGAKIEGTIFKNLEDVLKVDLTQENLVEKDLLQVTKLYDIGKVANRYKNFEYSFDKMFNAFSRAVSIYNDIAISAEKDLYINIDTKFNEFDKFFREMEKEKFFLMVIAPVTRVQYQSLISKITEINEIRIKKKRVQKYLEYFGKYMRVTYAAILEYQTIVGNLKKVKALNKEKQNENPNNWS